MEQVEELEALCEDVDGILSVGSGSLNDICRLAAYRRKKPLAIYATAPSMDGFASNSAPITKNNFKVSYPAVQPQVIIADTAVLAAAPAVLKSVGSGIWSPNISRSPIGALPR
jgi:glycerol-1-phosphate dehydrogenase [NAD(P)+]